MIKSLFSSNEILSTKYDQVLDNASTDFSTKKLSCEYFPSCSGCVFQSEDLCPPLWQNIKNYFTLKDPALKVPFFEMPPCGTRSRAKLAVRGTPDQPHIGLFKKGSHDVVDITACPLHTPPIDEALFVVREKMRRFHIHPYDEKGHRGLLRYLQLAVENQSQSVQLSLVVNSQDVDPPLRHFVEDLDKSFSWHSTWINFQKEKTNRIFGDQWLHFSGSPFFWQVLAGSKVAFHPACFSQVHLSLFEKMLFSIRQQILPNKKAIEFYAGVGAIGLAICEKVEHLIMNEINPFAKKCFEASKAQLSSEMQSRVFFEVGPAEQFISHLENASVAIVDPPRKGLDPLLLKAFCEPNHLEQLIYISCDFRSFCRDSDALLDAGWRIAKAEGYLFFPGTDHVEICCFFVRIREMAF
ncbi:MAG: hypothetical protein ACM3JI_00995 [Anaerolineae bacterium]